MTFWLFGLTLTDVTGVSHAERLGVPWRGWFWWKVQDVMWWSMCEKSNRKVEGSKQRLMHTYVVLEFWIWIVPSAICPSQWWQCWITYQKRLMHSVKISLIDTYKKTPLRRRAIYCAKLMLQNTFVTTKYSTPSQVVTLVMPFPKLSLEPL